MPARAAGELRSAGGGGSAPRGVRVIAAMLGVENARAQIGRVHPRHVSQAFGNGVVGVCHSGGVARRGLLDDIGALEDIQCRFGRGSPSLPGAHGRRIHPLEDALRLPAAAARAVMPRHDAVGVEVATDVTGTPGASHSAGQAAAKAHAGQDVLMLRVELTDGFPEPALGDDLSRARRCARCPCHGSANGSSWHSQCPGRWPPGPRRTVP